MKLFADTASVKDIEELLKLNVIQGVTTNPSLLAKEPTRDMVEVYKEIGALLLSKKYNPQGKKLPLSVEAVTEDLNEIVKQAKDLKEKIAYPYLNFKIPLGSTSPDRKDAWNELTAIHAVAEFMPVNATCVYTPRQAVMAAQAGASYVSPFFARIRDNKDDPVTAVRDIRKLLNGLVDHPVDIIAGSIRTPDNCVEAWAAGADIVTTGLKTIKELSYHPVSNNWVKAFMDDYQKWTAKKIVT